MKKPTLTAARRRRLYEVTMAALAVAVLYGLLEADKADAWLLLVAAVLGVARANVDDDA